MAPLSWLDEIFTTHGREIEDLVPVIFRLWRWFSRTNRLASVRSMFTSSNTTITPATPLANQTASVSEVVKLVVIPPFPQVFGQHFELRQRPFEAEILRGGESRLLLHQGHLLVSRRGRLLPRPGSFAFALIVAHSGHLSGYPFYRIAQAMHWTWGTRGEISDQEIETALELLDEIRCQASVEVDGD